MPYAALATTPTQVLLVWTALASRLTHKLKELVLDADGVLHAGAGVTWGEIYGHLEMHGRSAVGGRDNNVGVSGFLLGGGMPLFVNLHGFAADSLKSCEVSLATKDLDVVRHALLLTWLQGCSR